VRTAKKGKPSISCPKIAFAHVVTISIIDPKLNFMQIFFRLCNLANCASKCVTLWSCQVVQLQHLRHHKPL